METHVRTYHRLIDCPPVSTKNVNWMQKAWSFYFLPNKVREFILKFNGNILGLNTRVSHFADNVNRSCTFCTHTNLLPVPDETFLHLFFTCPVTSSWLTYFMNTLFMDIIPPGLDSLKQFWLLHLTGNEQCNTNIFFSCLLWLIKFSIWEAKLAKKKPSERTLMVDFLHEANRVYCSSTVLIDSKHSINIYVSRNWDRIRHGEW